jgi:ribA/ribD-fused uncharacterized protein
MNTLEQLTAKIEEGQKVIHGALPNGLEYYYAQLAQVINEAGEIIEKAPPVRINFYREGEAYGAFSNFSKHPIYIYQVIWKTSEAAFQAQKFFDDDIRRKILEAPNPTEAKRLGRSKQARRDWEQVKVAVMYEVIRAKFTQHEDLKELLLSTGDAYLAEHTKNDKFWGDGGDDTGKNMLGRSLMLLRAELK